jgi:hypothetical protein
MHYYSNIQVKFVNQQIMKASKATSRATIISTEQEREKGSQGGGQRGEGQVAKGWIWESWAC